MVEFLKFYCLVVAPLLSTFLISFAYVPQIVQNIRTKSVRDLSLGFWVLINAFIVNMIANALYLFLTAPNGLGYLLTEVANGVLAFTVLCQILYYRKKEVAK
ncbi:PQ-loop repeat-containing protein [Peribacillus frigoritolerans]|uniref:PQ-loop repeat-containing protein n=1 Tax=Peribacillus castrilensis TaxID=2897690 RepID=A0AAW9NG70_9BACI|nr:PQ-loop repeat-containing protein [Peribacillus castrilensis]